MTLNAEVQKELEEIIFKAFSSSDITVIEIADVLKYSIRKCEVIRKGPEYLPVLFENEIEDYQMRKRINEDGRMNHGGLLQNTRATA